MKIIVQLLLTFITILVGFFFYQIYFEPSLSDKKNKNLINEDVIQKNTNNLIKNLNYSVKFEDDTEYTITAELSELKYENNIELVNMINVVAKFKNKNISEFIVTSDNAVYNNSNYNTNFSNNVKIDYIDNVILSEKLDLNFDKNIVKIYDNVVYEGISGFGKTDNIIVNLITKNIEIFMNDKKNKVELISK
jgi:hypothetical protein